MAKSMNVCRSYNAQYVRMSLLKKADVYFKTQNCTNTPLLHVLLFILFSVTLDPTVTATTSDMTAIPGQTTTFKCIFTGVAIPYWVVNGVGDSPVTITQGSTVMSFTMPAISETDLEVQLDVSVDLSLNSTTYVCQSDFVGGRATSVPAALNCVW